MYSVGSVVMNLDWIIICEYAIRDKANKLSILGEFTSIFLHKFPGQLPSMYVVVRWKLAEGDLIEYPDKVMIAYSSGEVVAESEFLQVSQEAGRRTTTMHKFEFVTFPTPDKYFVETYFKDELMGKDHFFVRPANDGVTPFWWTVEG